MGLVDNASKNTDQADMAILMMIETVRDQKQPATASAVASLIGGAPVGDVGYRLRKMRHLGLVEEFQASNLDLPTFWLTEMGVELLRRDVEGWSPSPREEQRRADQLRRANQGLWRSRLR